MSTEVSFQARGRPATEVGRNSFSECNSALELMLTQRGNPSLTIERVLAGDPKNVYAHCLRAALIVRTDDFVARSAAAAGEW